MRTPTTVRDLRLAADAAVAADPRLVALREAYEHAAAHASEIERETAWAAYKAAQVAHPIAGPAWRAWWEAALVEKRAALAEKREAFAARVLDAETGE